MFEDQWLYLTIAAIIIIVALAGYAFKLLNQLKRQTTLQKQKKLEQIEAHNKHDKKILDSVVIIVRAMKEEQCDLSEGCWRLSVLLDSLKASQNLNLQFPAIFELHEAIKHMPILEERKRLEKKQRMKLDLERTKAEARLQPAVFENLPLLHNYALERLSAIAEGTK